MEGTTAVQECNGLKTGSGRTRGYLIQAAMRRIGPLVTFDDVNRALAAEGEAPTSKYTFFRNQRLLRGVPREQQGCSEEGPGAIKAAEPCSDLEEQLPLIESADRLSAFVRFMTAVELIGGIAKARQHLDIIEQLHKIR